MDDLPLELIVHILQYLSKKEQIKFSIVNKKFHEAVMSPSLWTENEKCLEVPPNRIKSFRKFLGQVPWLRNLNLKIYPIGLKKRTRIIDINLPSVLEPLKNLECLSLQFYDCKSIINYFPSRLKHISLWDYWSDSRVDTKSVLTDDLLKSLADMCPLLEHIEINSEAYGAFSRHGLRYLLEKVKHTLETLILSDYCYDQPAFCFLDCPPNVTTFCYKTSNQERDVDVHGQLVDLPNLENLKILSLNSSFPLKNEGFYCKKLSIPNLQILHLNSCNPDVDALMAFITCCPSLKVLAWHEPLGYSNKTLSELEKLSKEKSVKVYLNFNADEIENYCDELVLNFPLSFENFQFFFKKHPVTWDYFKCHAPIIKKEKLLEGIKY